MLILSAECNPVVAARAARLRIPVLPPPTESPGPGGGQGAVRELCEHLVRDQLPALNLLRRTACRPAGRSQAHEATEPASTCATDGGSQLHRSKGNEKGR